MSLWRQAVVTVGIAISLVRVPPLAAGMHSPPVKLLPSINDFSNGFGHDVAISGGTALVATHESVYAFKRQAAGNWLPTANIAGPRPFVYDGFGSSVALYGGTSIVGARFDRPSGRQTGSASIYRENPDFTWSRLTTLVGSELVEGDGFGISAGMTQGLAIVGTVGRVPNAGSAYLFAEDSSGDWSEVAKLLPDDPSSQREFGASVALSEGVAIVGAPTGGLPLAAAFVYKPDSSGQWGLIEKLIPNDAVPNSRFALSVAIDGATAIVGAPHSSELGRIPGAAYIFREDDFGQWNQIAKLTVDEDFGGFDFGASVSISGGLAVVGSPSDDGLGNGPGAGQAFVFQENAAGHWNLIRHWTAQDGAAGDAFGRSVALSGVHAMVGAPLDDHNFIDAGSSYVFEVPEPSPVCLTMLAAACLATRRRRHFLG